MRRCLTLSYLFFCFVVVVPILLVIAAGVDLLHRDAPDHRVHRPELHGRPNAWLRGRHASLQHRSADQRRQRPFVLEQEVIHQGRRRKWRGAGGRRRRGHGSDPGKGYSQAQRQWLEEGGQRKVSEDDEGNCGVRPPEHAVCVPGFPSRVVARASSRGWLLHVRTVAVS